MAWQYHRAQYICACTYYGHPPEKHVYGIRALWYIHGKQARNRSVWQAKNKKQISFMRVWLRQTYQSIVGIHYCISRVVIKNYLLVHIAN